MFNGEIYEKLGEGIEVKMVKRAGGEAFHATINGLRVIAKEKKAAISSLWKDELKPYFGLEKVGMSYFRQEDLFILKFHPNLGTLKASANKVLPEAFGAWFIRLCIYDYVIQNGDRHSNNILLISPRRLMAIDEAVSKRPPDLWCPRFSQIITDKILQSIANLVKDRRELEELVRNEFSSEAIAGIYEVTSRYDDLVGPQTISGLEKTIATVSTGIGWMDYMWAKFGEERYK